VSRFLIAAAIVALAVSSIPAGAATSDSATLKPVEAIFAGGNANDSAAIAAAYSSDALIIDEFPPFRWSGPKAAATWWNGFGAFLTKVGISNGHLIHAKPTFLSYDTAKTTAYVVMPSTFTYKSKGKAQTEIGRWVFILKKSATGWHVAVSTWATVSDTGR
jgi:ketosteroid isomerase-like protein